VRDFPEISIDLETYDPELTTKGPGWATMNGHIVGIAVGTPDGKRHYFPMRHEIGGGNLDAQMVLKWARDELTRPGQLKIGANLLYDLGWLAAEGVDVPGPYYDVQWAEALLDEHRDSYSLEAIAQDYFGEGKQSNLMYEWAAKAYGGPATGKAQAGRIHKCPARLVGPYAESDVDLPLRIRERQLPRIAADRLENIVDLEHSLIPLLLRMRMNGVRVDREAADRADRDMEQRITTMQRELEQKVGRKISVDSPADLKAVFDTAGVQYPLTKAGNPSFQKAWLERCEHPAAQMIVDIRKLSKMQGTFVQGAIKEFAINGRVYPELHPLRNDEYGTVSGRFSCSRPAAQTIPSRDEIMKKLLRGMFLPEVGERWVSMDYSQIEYRLLVHAAKGDAGAMARRLFNDDPTTDYHEYTGKLVERTLHRELDRKPLKNINFGTIFGMGVPKLKSMLGLSDSEAEEFFSAYNAAIPYAMETREAASKYATREGHIRTILGRLARFPLWESKDWGESQRDGFMTYAEAVAKYGERGIRRARTHKALNSYTQGGGADIMKASMRSMWDAGLFEVLTPLLTVHDEMNVSAPFSAAGDEAMHEMKHLMETVAPMLKVPLIAEVEVGMNWGALEKIKAF